MDSSADYRAIPVGDHPGLAQLSSAATKKSWTYVIGAILLVVSTALVTAHVTTREYKYGAPYGAEMTPRSTRSRYADAFIKMRAAGASVSDEDFREVVRGTASEICAEIKYTACRYSSARETDWCKICSAFR